ncbi:MAG TPA: DUF92 domain-containing protein [Candidatus Baltobacteraceae bacterium]
MTRILIGIAFAGAVALLARRAHALTPSGALAAWVVGACVFAAGGWPYAAVLFAFFIPATLLSRIGRSRKRGLVDIGKHGARDAWQVAANGGVAALCAVLAAVFHQSALTAAFAGAFAAASADTWGTEIGTLAKQRPRSILTLKPLATGLSGGVSLAGTLAEIAGAAVVSVVAWALGGGPWWIVAAGGFAGALADSVIGASVQELRYCPQCARECETDPHVCGSATVLRRGLPWISNDAVNACAAGIGALASLGLSVRFF